MIARMKALSFLWTFLFAVKVFAGFGNYNNVLIGDLAAGMGGASVAVTEDASALPWYNPAGLSELKSLSYSSAVGQYKKFDTRFSNEEITKAGLRANQGFFKSVPSSTASITRFSEFLSSYAVGLSILVPQYDVLKTDIVSTESQTSNVNSIDESLWVGFTAGKTISERESMGFSLYYVARSFSRSILDRQQSGSDVLSYIEEKNYTQNGLSLIVGYINKLNPEVKIGVSFRGPFIPIASNASASSFFVDSANNIYESKNFANKSADLRIPTKLLVGMSYEPSEKWLWAADLSLYGKTSYRDVSIEDEILSEKIQHQDLLNVAIGGEYRWKSYLKLRGGVFSNLSSHPDPVASQSKGQADRVDQLGWSANVAFLRGNIQYTFGGYYNGGRGRSIQRVGQQYLTYPKSHQEFTMLVGASYDFK